MCCHVEMVLLVVQLCTGGGHEASLLVRGGNGMFVGHATGGIDGSNAGLVGSTAGHVNLLFMVIWLQN